MSGELTLLVLRLVFLAIMWIFIFSIIYALRSDLFGSRSRDYQRAMEQSRQQGTAPQPQPVPAAAPTPAAAQAPRPQQAQPQGPATFEKVVLTSGPRRGTEIKLSDQPLLIGRSPDADLRIQDDYTSTRHARLLKWNDTWMVQDLDSTNGTYVNDERVSQPVEIRRGTVVRIGTTTFELR
ncbi:FHA domain-containing protein FhaB/FipA [Gulosibacter sp. ACHW.36C]|uniref:FHA domain-containing protein n=1 Tax=Gulosibacter sediminis TaxID=1729695 RepID=A0ABY4MWV7_9MICO|nr:FHA domain-containing protein [Gulosibacter sediminis]UQN14859.1 FHA domain-containing protein [Gulosibacter sediminis]